MSSPFAVDSKDELGNLGEIGLLKHIRAWLGETAPPSPYGMGDDTAVLQEADHNLITTDSLVFGRHFDASLNAETAGAKLLKRNLSDIAAMGGTPRAAVLAGFLPANTSIQWLEAFVHGLKQCAIDWNVAIVGGDLTQTDAFLGFNLTLTGHATRPMLRAKAEAGDLIWVTGELGGSIRHHHAHFEPRLKEGQYLAQDTLVHTMIDLTDGLAKDLPTLLQKNLCAALDISALPLREEAKTSDNPLKAAFTDGEDYELLFTTSAEWAQGNWENHFKTRLTCIGKIVTPHGADSLLLDMQTGKPLNFGQAYEHFRSA